MTEMKRDGLVHGMPERDYHAPRDELSSTGAKTIVNECPARFKYEVLDGNRVHRAGYDLGTIVHTKVLGVGTGFIEYPPEHLTPAGNVSTKAATVTWEEEQRANGATMLTPDQAKQADAMAEAVLGHYEARRLMELEGDSEVSMFDSLRGVKRRGRIDRLPREGGSVIDLKSTIDASPRGFVRSIAKFGYHIQRGHYLSILESITGERRDMLFIAVEKTAPYLVGVHRVNEQFAEIGEAEALDAVDTYRRCTDTGHWPAYEGINMLQPPMGVIYDYQDKYESGEITL